MDSGGSGSCPMVKSGSLMVPLGLFNDVFKKYGMIFKRLNEKNVVRNGRNQFQGNILAFDAEENYETYVKTVCHRAGF
jgi:hypothetical protein